MSSGQSVAEVVWDPFAPPADPYPIYEVLRDRFPLYRNSDRNIWALSRYADVQGANRDWKKFSYSQGVDIDNVGDWFRPGDFLLEDPPLHTVLRNVVKDRFRVGILRDGMSAVVESEVDGLLEAADGTDLMDFGLECAWNLPIRIGAHLMGFPLEDVPVLRDIADEAFSNSVGLPGSDAQSASAKAAIAVRKYFEDQIEDRRRNPKDDMLTSIATATVEGEPIGDRAAGTAALIFAGSVDSTALTLTSAVDLLGSHPDQRQWLRNNPERIGDAVEEVLRFESPIQSFKRTTTSDMQLYDQTVPAGSTILLIYGSANRDPRQFERPDKFDIQRKFTRHIAFGEGVHHCLGAPLARIEVTTMLRKFLELVPDYEVVESERSGRLRGFRSIKIKRT